MKNIRDVLTEIEKVLIAVQTNYPELYRTLDENPITIPAKNHPDVGKEAMLEYLESLKQLLKHHLETHKKGIS
ncbi:MAG: hypothetical protein H2058_10520 [Muricauda sp.]|nr:hypothetical protein [Allomuricauda sp.]MBA4745683.1 hypothetical protein [Allomuricauda sp.]